MAIIELKDWRCEKVLHINLQHKGCVIKFMWRVRLIPQSKTEISTYSLQQELYKYLLEKYTDIKVKACYLVWFNANNESYEIIKTKNVDKYMKIILNDLHETKENRISLTNK